MKNILFGALFVVSTILTSCGNSTSTVEEVKPTEDTTKTETVTVTTPSVDSTKVDSVKVKK